MQSTVVDPEQQQKDQAARADWAKRDFESFNSKAISKSGAGPENGKEIDLRDLTRDEYEAWQKTGEVPRDKPRNAFVGKEVKAEEDSGPSNDSKDDDAPDPAKHDHLWVEGKRYSEKERQDIGTRVEKMAGKAMDHIESHPRRADIESGLRNMFAGREAMQNDAYMAIAEVPNPGEVIAHLGLQPQDRQTLLAITNARDLRAAVHRISKHVMPKPEAKPRAPKPPSQVGGRASSIGDESVRAAKEGRFDLFAANENAKKFGRAR